MTDSFSPQKSPHLVLIADGDGATRSLLRQVMEQAGYKIAEATDEEACLNAHAHLRPQLILLDAGLPKRDGFACCAQLQQLPESDRPPVLMLLSSTDEATINRAFEVGAADFITKPIHITVLQQRVHRFLQANRALEELRCQTEREHLLRTLLTKQIRRSLILDEILDTTVVEVRKFLQVERVVIYHFGFSGDSLVVAEAVDSEWPALAGVIVDSSWFKEQIGCYQQRQVVATPDWSQKQVSGIVSEFLRQYQVKASLEVPILQDDRLWGVLVAHQCAHPRQWTAFEINLLEQLATQVALAIRQAEIYQQLEKANQALQRLATLDGLTQVANRRRFDEYLRREWRRSARDQAHLSLILCDIDFFKLYNDTYGHQAGDGCLQQVAKVISQCVNRPADLVARYGGEEFAVILPNTKATGAVQIAEIVRSQVKELEIEHVSSRVSQYVTLSLGVASAIPGKESVPVELVAAADKALYQAKTEGRDRVVLNRFWDLLSPPTNYNN